MLLTVFDTFVLCCLFVCLFVCLFACLLVCLVACLFVCLFVCLFFCFLFASAFLFACLVCWLVFFVCDAWRWLGVLLQPLLRGLVQRHLVLDTRELSESQVSLFKENFLEHRQATNEYAPFPHRVSRLLFQFCVMEETY